MKELRFAGSYGDVWISWQRTVQLFSDGQIRADEVVSHEFPLEPKSGSRQRRKRRIPSSRYPLRGSNLSPEG